MSASRRFDEPRPVEVEHEGRWWLGLQHGWVARDGAWWADVEWIADHDWGRGKYVRVVPADRVRPV